MAKNLLVLVPELLAWEVDVILRVVGSEYWWDNDPNKKPPPYQYAFIDVEELIEHFRTISNKRYFSLMVKLETYAHGKE